MATILDKDLIRESTVKVDEREVVITLTADQKISFKLKGMKSGILTISIEDLYNQLRGGNVESDLEVERPRKKMSEDSISLVDLRSHNMISDMDYPTKVKFDTIIKNLIES